MQLQLLLSQKSTLRPTRDELMFNVQQQPGEGIHALSQHICDLVTKSKFAHSATPDMLTIMVLQPAVQYHEARDWIRQ